MTDKKMWMVRAGERGYLFQQFKDESIVALDFKRIGDATKLSSKQDIQERVEESYPSESNQKKGQKVGVFYKFLMEMKKDNWVITYNRDTREYLVGKITGDYQYSSDREESRHTRKVEWQKMVNRDALTDSAKNSLGGLATLFSVSDEHRDEILDREISRPDEDVAKTEDEDEAAEPETPTDLAQKAKDAIEDKVVSMTSRNMEKFIAALLQAMGYDAVVTSQSKDGGYDVFASPDGLMFEEPRIRAEVKQQKQKIGAPEMRNFLQAKGRARGVYYCTAGFTDEARSEARNSEVTTLNSSQLIELVIKHYDNFDIEGRMLLPMKKIYLPQ